MQSLFPRKIEEEINLNSKGDYINVEVHISVDNKNDVQIDDLKQKLNILFMDILKRLWSVI